MNSLPPRLIFALQGVLILAAIGFVYAPTLTGGWLWDDDVAIGHNHLVQDPGGLTKIWFASDNLDYYPLKASIEWAEWRLWGDRPAGYRATNLMLGALGALLLWRLLWKLGVKQAWLGGLLFAVHPLAVESVAWISELKNTLSLPLLLMAMICYVEFDAIRNGGAILDGGARCPQRAGSSGGVAQRVGDNALHSYFWSLGLFLAALLSKSSVVMFPVVLLLYSWWRRGRVSRSDVRAASPFFALSLIFGLVTVLFQTQRTEMGAAILGTGFFVRTTGALRAVAFYFSQCLWPVRPLPIYPGWSEFPLWPQAVVCLGGGFFCWLAARRGAAGRAVGFGLACFVINLVPVLGFVPMTFLRIAPVSDHLAYLPLAGLMGMVAGGAGLVSARWRGGWRSLAAVGALVLCAVLAVRSRRYAEIYRTPAALWSYAVQENPGTWLGENNLAIELRDAGDLPKAIGHFENAVRIRPVYPEAHFNLAGCLERAGRVPEAISQYEEAVEQQPNYVPALNSLGVLLAGVGRSSEAIPRYEQALRFNPNYYEAENNLANALVQVGRSGDAIAHYDAVLRLRPAVPEVHYNLGFCLASVGRHPEAEKQFEEALRLKPDYPEAHFRLGIEWVAAGRLPEAIAHYEEALRLKPAFPEAEDNLGVALANSGRLTDAIPHFKRAVGLRPDYAKAQQDLALALRATGREPK